MANNRELSQFANIVGHNGGNIGIGTATPGAILEVFDATSNTIVNVKSGDSGAVLNLIDDSARSSIEQNGTTLKISSDTGAEDASSDIRLQVDGSTKMLVNSSGFVGINETSPSTHLHVEQDNAHSSTYYTNSDAAILVDNKNASGKAVIKLEHDAALVYGSGSSSFIIADRENERLRITSDGLVKVGGNETVSAATGIQIENAGAALLTLLRNDSTISEGNTLGGIDFYGNDGGSVQQIAKISAVADGTHGDSDKPTALVFQTTNDGAGSATEKLRITSAGKVGINESNPDQALHVKSADGDTVPARIESTGAQSRLGFQASGSVTSYHVSCGAEANNFIVHTNNTERLRVTSGGNIGVNESSNINGRLHVQHDALNENILYSTRYNDQSNDKPIFAVTEATMSGMTASGTVIGNHNRDIHIGPVFDSSAAVSTSIVTGIRIEAVTGNIGLGTDNPADILHLQNNAPIITSEATNNSSGLRINVLGQTTDTTQIFRVQRDGTTKFTILRSGNVGVNYTTPVGKFCVKEDTSSSTTTIFRVRSDWGSSNQTQMLVLSDGDIENRNNAYRAISDAKLKENIVDASSQWEDIKNLRVRNYNFIEGHGDPSKTHIGVVAQEVETVCPGLVKERPDQDDETGDYLGTVTKSVSYSVLYMKAVKALQEAQTRIETLESQHADLLARVTALEG